MRNIHWSGTAHVGLCAIRRRAGYVHIEFGQCSAAVAPRAASAPVVLPAEPTEALIRRAKAMRAPAAAMVRRFLPLLRQWAHGRSPRAARSARDRGIWCSWP